MTDVNTVRTVQQTDLFTLKFMQSGQLSPDGNLIVYEVAQVVKGEKDDEEHSTLWLLSLKTGEMRQLTYGTGRNTSPQWSPDGKQIAFVSSRDKKLQLHIIPADGGEARALTSFKQGVGLGIAWSPDGKMIAFVVPAAAEPPDLSKPYRLTRHVYRFDKVGYVDGLTQDIYTIPA